MGNIVQFPSRRPKVKKSHSITPSDLDLQAFIDDELSSEDRIRICAWLLDHSDHALEVFQTMLREEILRLIAKQRSN